ncbi:hypothetical protein YDYSG_44580 [Paenibacillus tyrfis]|uniref:hypothetical protein n=1 Tax=Paenibacillus tyrfis TaxID=1501230 RepID=UPI00248FA9B6|nr:hypothetical protein [Paenibacillus tyrfis]GLI08427.1 hypothetical protein YDYSG_44580 [Paenibacillus tyrfis]
MIILYSCILLIIALLLGFCYLLYKLVKKVIEENGTRKYKLNKYSLIFVKWAISVSCSLGPLHFGNSHEYNIAFAMFIVPISIAAFSLHILEKKTTSTLFIYAFVGCSLLFNFFAYWLDESTEIAGGYVVFPVLILILIITTVISIAGIRIDNRK